MSTPSNQKKLAERENQHVLDQGVKLLKIGMIALSIGCVAVAAVIIVLDSNYNGVNKRVTIIYFYFF